MQAGRVDIADRIEGPRRPVRLCLPLAPGLEPRLVAEHRVALGLRNAGRLSIALPPAHWRIEDSDYYPRFGEVVRRKSLVGESDAFERGIWEFRLDS